LHCYSPGEATSPRAEEELFWDPADLEDEDPPMVTVDDEELDEDDDDDEELDEDDDDDDSRFFVPEAGLYTG
jgi:hypothetical protein